ncbi:MAG: riboflavin synthase [Opitutae bacterium]|jgi:riboflavin synthase|nr:riboflavin synthase [Opitutae bacterium]
MFAGIVEDAGKVLSLEERPEAWLLRLALPFVDSDGLEAGSSLSVNGCCLTLRENSDGKEASFDLLEETMERTNLSGLTEGSSVNLERSLPANGRVGGHFVTGHVDVLGEIEVFEERGKNLYLQVKVPSDCVRYLVDKGCIAVDGCSLTVCDVKGDSFAIWLIPHTLAKTNLPGRKPGDFLNVEFDLLAKYVEKLTMSSLENSGS